MSGRWKVRSRSGGSIRGGRLKLTSASSGRDSTTAVGSPTSARTSTVPPAARCPPMGQSALSSTGSPSSVTAKSDASVTVTPPSAPTATVNAHDGSRRSGSDQPVAPLPTTLSPSGSRWMRPAPGPETTRSSATPAGAIRATRSAGSNRLTTAPWCTPAMPAGVSRSTSSPSTQTGIRRANESWISSPSRCTRAGTRSPTGCAVSKSTSASTARPFLPSTSVRLSRTLLPRSVGSGSGRAHYVPVPSRSHRAATTRTGSAARLSSPSLGTGAPMSRVIPSTSYSRSAGPLTGASQPRS